jgi:hypothetical protein
LKFTISKKGDTFGTEFAFFPAIEKDQECMARERCTGESGELFSPRQRYGLVGRHALIKLLDIGMLEQLRIERRNCTDTTLDSGASTWDE